jgi:hypothetical protein
MRCAAQIERFHDNSYLIVGRVLARGDALATQDAWWSELTEAHRTRHDDGST